jgi:hypothetical protein
VKNKIMKIRFWVFALALTSALITLGCQKVQLAEYKKYSSDAEGPRMTVEEAKKDVDAGIAAIVDARGDAAYKAERIKGSLNITNEAQFDQLPKDKKLIVYCS